MGEQGVPVSGVLGKEWLSLPGAEGEPAPPEGRQEVGGDGKEGETSATPVTRRPPPVGPGRRKGEAGAGARWRGCRREAGAAGGAHRARKAVLGAVPVWPTAGWGLE